jgi:NhaP-type Na+/H+ or K+/H+ antiporter
MSAPFRKICWVALVILTFFVAEHFGGNGFIAAFCFGITSGNTLSKRESGALYQYAEVENAFLMLLTYIIFGTVMLPPALEKVDPTVVVYAVLSLSAVRMVPVAISMLGAKLRAITVLYLGWFGPRGIASILYVLTVLAAGDIAARDTIYSVAMVTVFLSVMAHGVSASSLAAWYGKHMARLDAKGLVDAETTAVPELPTRARRAPAGADSFSATYSSG